MKNIKIIFLKIILLPSWIFNFIIIKLKKIKYLNYPEINGSIIIRGRGKIFLGKKVKINSSFSVNPVGLNNKTAFYTSPNSEIIIGNNVGISNTLFYALNSIKIEDNVLIGGGCQILDNDFHPLNYDKRILNDDSEIKSKPIIVEEGAFIGASSIILKGVTIGKKSIIGAGSVVTKSVPENEIWGGNPAVFIKKL